MQPVSSLVQVRNQMVAYWRNDVSAYLSEPDALEHLPRKLQPYAAAAWRFLNAAGWINFGVSPALIKRSLELPETQGTVVVIGAGLAGAPLPL